MDNQGLIQDQSNQEENLLVKNDTINFIQTKHRSLESHTVIL